MPRLDINRSGEMEVFVRAVELGGFSAAARSLRITPSAVSKLVRRLESRLGVRLLTRSTRKLQLTAEGANFYDHGVRILRDIDTAEREAAAGAPPRGHLRVNANVPFGMLRLLPLLPEFLARYPDIVIDLSLTETVVDLLEARADIAIRSGPLRESQLVARKLIESRRVVVAAPAYLERYGEPRTLEALSRHKLLDFNFVRQVDNWIFLDGSGGTVTLKPLGNALASDGEVMRQLVLSGVGLARLARWHVDADIEAGRLMPVLEAYNPGDIQAVHAVFVGPGRHLPARARVFLDYLVEKIRSI